MEEEIKHGFFKSVWTSIRDFEKYEEFAAERITKTLKYLLLLTLIFTLAITAAYTYKFNLIIQDVKEYIKQNVDEISLINGKLEIISNEPIIIENEKQAIPVIIVDTSEDANLNELVEKTNAYENGIILLNNRVVLSSNLLTQNQNIYYSSLFDQNINNKEELINLISGKTMIYTYLLFFATIFLYLFIVYLSSNLVDSVVLGALGFIFARLVKLRLRFKATLSIGVHALTLPILLNLIYIIINTFTGFNINYFGWMYTTISYIYVAVAILMIKAEIINQKIGLTRIEKIQEDKPKEEQEQTEEKEEKKENKKDEKKDEEEDTGDEPEANNA